jgi:uncharacterized protein YjeT (DUF2065 family)
MENYLSHGDFLPPFLSLTNVLENIVLPCSVTEAKKKNVASFLELSNDSLKIRGFSVCVQGVEGEGKHL